MAEETPNEQFVRDFNNGYLIAEKIPSLAKQLSSIEISSQRSGFKDGINQYFIEVEKANKPSWLNRDTKKDDVSPTQDKQNDLDRD